MKRSRSVGSPGTELFCLLLGDGCGTASEEGIAERGRQGERERPAGRGWKSPRKPAPPTDGGNRGGNRGSPSPAALCGVHPRRGADGLVRLLLSAHLPGLSLRGFLCLWFPPHGVRVGLAGRGAPWPLRVAAERPPRGRARVTAGPQRGWVVPTFSQSPRRPLTAPAAVQQLHKAPGPHNAVAVWGACRPQPARRSLPAVRCNRLAGHKRRAAAAPSSPARGLPALRRSPPPPAALSFGPPRSGRWRCRGAAGPRGAFRVAGGRDCSCTGAAAGGARARPLAAPRRGAGLQVRGASQRRPGLLHLPWRGRPPVPSRMASMVDYTCRLAAVLPSLLLHLICILLRKLSGNSRNVRLRKGEQLLPFLVEAGDRKTCQLSCSCLWCSVSEETTFII